MVGDCSDGVFAKALFVKGLRKQKGRKKEAKEAKASKNDRKGTKENGKELIVSEKARTAAE